MQITVEPSRALCSRHGMRLLVAVVQLFIAPRGFFDENAKEGGMYRSFSSNSKEPKETEKRVGAVKGWAGGLRGRVKGWTGDRGGGLTGR